jgi:hypothetical protein
MKRPLEILVPAGLLLAVLAAGVVAVRFLLADAFASACANNVVAEYPSPDRTHKVVVFQRDCGATTDFSTQASLLASAETLPNEGGNLFVADTNHGTAPAASWGGPTLAVQWSGSTSVVLEHDPKVRTFKSESHHGEVAVSYVQSR